MFKVAIVGKPNVGKTTLFNKLIGKKIAITHNMPGITRDRKEFDTEIAGIKMRLIDTAGIENAKSINAIEQQMLEQSYYAIDEADICLLMVDGKHGITNEDIQFLRILQKKKKDNFITLINKGEGLDQETIDSEFYALGVKHFIIISAEHSIGLHDLVLSLKEKYLEYTAKYGEIDVNQNEKNALQIAIVGKPNAGKSTLINSLIGQNRLIVTPIAGTTRDAIPVDFVYKDNPIKIIDTAGIRKKMNIGDDIEEMSVAESFRAIDFAHVVILLVDVNSLFDAQDAAIASRVNTEGRILIICINKWDTIKDAEKKDVIKKATKWLEAHPNIANNGSFFTLSAKDDKDLYHILDEAILRHQKWQTKISTSKLNDWLLEIKTHSRNPPIINNKPLKLKFINQIHTKPPFFKISANFLEVPENYATFLKAQLVKKFDLAGIPIRLDFRKAENPFEKNKKK